MLFLQFQSKPLPYSIYGWQNFSGGMPSKGMLSVLHTKRATYVYTHRPTLPSPPLHISALYSKATVYEKLNLKPKPATLLDLFLHVAVPAEL